MVVALEVPPSLHKNLIKLSVTELSVRVWGTESTVYFLGFLQVSKVICIVFFYKPE